MQQGPPDRDDPIEDLARRVGGLTINVHVHSASASTTTPHEPAPAGPPTSSAGYPGAAGGTTASGPGVRDQDSEIPPRVLDLARHLRAPRLGGLSPADRVRRAYTLGQISIRRGHSEFVDIERDSFKLRNTCYAVVSARDPAESFYTQSYDTYIQHAKPNGHWVRHLSSRGFASLVEVEAFFWGAGLDGLPRCLA